MKKCNCCGQSIVNRKPHWWHWVVLYCPSCQTNTGGQIPVRDDLGEDCNLFDEVYKYKADNPVCSCGNQIMVTYRHALADRNCVTRGDKYVYAIPLLPGQTYGTFIEEEKIPEDNTLLSTELR